MSMNLHLCLNLRTDDDGVRFTAGEDYQNSRQTLAGTLTPKQAVKLARHCDDAIGYEGDAPGPLEKKIIKELRQIAAGLPEETEKRLTEGARRVALGKAIAEALP